MKHKNKYLKLKSKWKYLDFKKRRLRKEHLTGAPEGSTHIQKGKQENLEKYRKVKSILIVVGLYVAVPP